MQASAPHVNRIQDQRDFFGSLVGADEKSLVWDDAANGGAGGFTLKTITTYTDGQAQAATGWQDDGATVRLVTLTNHVGIGTATPDFSTFGSTVGLLGIEGSAFGVLNLRKSVASATLDADLGAIDGYNGATRIASVKFAGGGATDSGELRFYTRATGGALALGLRLNSAALTPSVPLLAASGSISAPGLAFSAEPGLGLYRSAVANRLNVAVGGSNIAAFGSGTSLATGFAGMVEGKFRCYGFSCTIDGTYTWDVSDRTTAHGQSVPVTTAYHASQSGYFECATGFNGAGATCGGFIFGASAHSAGHKFVCGTYGVTSGSTANQYGGTFYFQTKKDGNTGLNVAHFDHNGIMDIPSGLVVGEGLNTLNAAAIAQFTSTTKGVLLPRLTTAQRDAISAPPAGLLIYNTTTGKLNFRAAAAWEAVTSAAV